MKKSPVKITLTKGEFGESYRVTRMARAMSTHVSIPGRDKILVGDTLNPKEADSLCDQRHYEVTIQ